MKAKGVVVYNNDGMEEIKILQARVAELEEERRIREVCRHCAHFDRDPHAYCRLFEAHVSPAASCASFKWPDL